MSNTPLSLTVDELLSLNAYHLANMADCGTPDSMESAGAKLLTSVRDSVIELLEESDEWHYLATSGRVSDLDDDGRVHEIADGAPDVYTYTRWQEFVDLAAYNEDPSELGDSGDDLTQTAGVALYIIAERLVWALLESASETYREMLDREEES